MAQTLAERGFGKLRGGSLYPVLARLEEAGHVDTRWWRVRAARAARTTSSRTPAAPSTRRPWRPSRPSPSRSPASAPREQPWDPRPTLCRPPRRDLMSTPQHRTDHRDRQGPVARTLGRGASASRALRDLVDSFADVRGREETRTGPVRRPGTSP
nr:helix-turn-helix transcriptional regulator [Micrococcus sp. FDAARGOS_333]